MGNLESLLHEITSTGWTLAYLRQAGLGWEALITRPSTSYGINDISFHYASTPSEALEGALAAEPAQSLRESWNQPASDQRLNILSALGLSKPINRRF